MIRSVALHWAAELRPPCRPCSAHGRRLGILRVGQRPGDSQTDSGGEVGWAIEARLLDPEVISD